MRRPYSRLARTEERKNKRQAVFFAFLTIAALVVLFVFGLPTIAKFATLLTGLKQSSQPIEKIDTTPPAPPQINILPEATNEQSIEISGSAEPAATLVFSLNGKERELLVDSEGKFSFSINLRLGENRIFAKAVDSAGNESQETPTISVLYDTEEPTLELLTPEDGSDFYGAKQRQVVIEGQTEPGASLTINDRFVAVEDDGAFSFATTLSEGSNELNVKAKDAAGNVTEEKLTLNFSP